MKFYSGIVKCATCGVALSKAINVPEDRLLDAAISASSRAFCAGHSKNSNLDFEWLAQPEGQIAPPAPPPVPVEERTFRGGFINMPEDTPIQTAAGNPGFPPGTTVQTVETRGAISSGEIPAPPRVTPRVTPDGIALEDLAEAAGVDPGQIAITEDAVYIGAKDENGVPQPVRVIGKSTATSGPVGGHMFIGLSGVTLH
jgi:hypothetical protein